MVGDKQRVYGAYYTPKPLAKTLVRWALSDGPGLIMDPSYGGCAFVGSAVEVLAELGASRPADLVFGVDIDSDCSVHVNRDSGLKWENFKTVDFLALSPDDEPELQAIVGNPPYVRHHRITPSTSLAARDAVAVEQVSRRGSLWAYFVLHSLDFLAEGGRLAFLVPEAIIQTDYGSQVLEVLKSHFAKTILISIGERLFEDTNERVIALLGEGTGAGDVYWAHANSVGELEELLENGAATQLPYVSGGVRSLDSRANSLFKEVTNSAQVTTLGAVCKLTIGVVTGANDFFLMRNRDVDTLGIPPGALLPAIATGRHLSSLRFTRDDFEESRISGGKCYLCSPTPDLVRESAALRSWVSRGETLELDQGYKCSRRSPWYRLNDAAFVADSLLTCTRSGSPLLISNPAAVHCLNNLHRLTWTASMPIDADSAAVCFLTSLTALAAERWGRRYGSGALKIEPSAAKRLPLPLIKVGADAVDRVDSLLRSGDEASARGLADSLVLVQGLGLSEDQVSIMREASSVLSDERGTRRATHG